MLTDLYELTMAYGFWARGMRDMEAVFHLSFREEPFSGGFAIACGLGPIIEYIDGFRFTEEDTRYLATLRGNDGNPLFSPDFLDYLRSLRLSCDVDAVPEGSVVFAHEPLLRVSGPIIQAQLLETTLLNIINFQTLVATKAARVNIAAAGDRVIEFGLRRAHGIDGGLSASRASYVGGCWGTSNTMAGQKFGIPVGGTQAHSWIMAFDDELSAFEAYADALPNNVILLVDTYDSIQGVHHAVEIGRRLRERGFELGGVRLDSGDLAWLSQQARSILDEGGFPDAIISASNELDEHVITSLKQQNAAINLWGVGTRLVTAYDQPALGGVYKLAAVRMPGEEWQYRIKLSEQASKITNPGLLQVRRFELEGEFIGDMIYDSQRPPTEPATIIDPLDLTRRKQFPARATTYEMLVPVFRGGRRVYDPPRLAASRDFAREQLARCYPGIKRFINPHQYPVGLEKELHATKMKLVLEARGLKREERETPQAGEV